MSLKTDYKDAMYDGQRRYRMGQNTDGTVSFTDTTSYTQAGDQFGARDINATNTAVNRLNHVTELMLTAAGWEGGGPFVQMVSVPGAAADMEPLLVSALPDDADAAAQKTYTKAFGIISCGTATVGNGTVIFKAYKKPATDCKVGLKGV